MRDEKDVQTIEMFGEIKKRGRPRKLNKVSNAEKQRNYRERKKKELMETLKTLKEFEELKVQLAQSKLPKRRRTVPQ